RWVAQIAVKKFVVWVASVVYTWAALSEHVDEVGVTSPFAVDRMMMLAPAGAAAVVVMVSESPTPRPVTSLPPRSATKLIAASAVGATGRIKRKNTAVSAITSLLMPRTLPPARSCNRRPYRGGRDYGPVRSPFKIENVGWCQFGYSPCV